MGAGLGIYLRSSINRKIRQDIKTAGDLHSQGEYSESVSLIRGVLEKKPAVYEKTHVKFILADSLGKLGEQQEATEIWKEIASGPQDEQYYPASLFHLGLIEKNRGGVSEAAAAFEKVIENFPRSSIIPEAYFHLADCLRTMRNWEGARENYEKLINSFPGSAIAVPAKDELGKLNIYLIHSPAITVHDIPYEVRPGDTLERIARQHNTTVELIIKANDLPGAMIPVGKRLKLTPSNFEIFVDADENVMTLTLNERFFKRYPVGTGEYGKTPLGEFKIINKMVHPVWYSEDGIYPYGHPKNILGTRWLGLDRRGYGLHGTAEPESIGKHETAGCVRMLNEDVEELFDLVIVGTLVTIEGTSLPDAW